MTTQPNGPQVRAVFFGINMALTIVAGALIITGGMVELAPILISGVVMFILVVAIGWGYAGVAIVVAERIAPVDVSMIEILRRGIAVDGILVITDYASVTSLQRDAHHRLVRIESIGPYGGVIATRYAVQEIP